MEDRELLDMAAKAAGISVEWNGEGCPIEKSTGRKGYDIGRFWNPLANDGDALRLATYLGILLRTDFIRLLGQLIGEGMEHGKATRLAIVRIASEIGKISL